MDTEYFSPYAATHWKKPDEIMKLRKRKTSYNSIRKTLEKPTTVTTLSPKPPKPNPFKTKSSDIKRLEKENKGSILLRGNLLKVCWF